MARDGFDPVNEQRMRYDHAQAESSRGHINARHDYWLEVRDREWAALVTMIETAALEARSQQRSADGYNDYCHTKDHDEYLAAYEAMQAQAEAAKPEPVEISE